MLKRKKKTAKWPFFAGLGVGAALGMVMAPKSGSELREDMQDFARESYAKGREHLQPLIDQTRERVEPLMDNVRERVDSVTSQAADVRDRVVETVADLKERVVNGGLLSILNEWPHERLIEIDGIGPVLATKIIKYRPYESEEAFIAMKQLPPSAIESLRKAA